MMLDKLAGLKKITEPVVDGLVNYALPTIEQRFNEAFDAVKRTLGGVQKFAKLNVSGPTFTSLGVSKALGTLDSKNPYFNVAASLSSISLENSATALQLAAELGENRSDDSHKVKLVSRVNGAAVVFDVMPTVSETRQADYEPLSTPHMPGEFQKYRGTKSASWQINATFICRTSAEATQQLHNLATLRSWVMPYFGDNSPSELLGAPPDVLDFSGWRGIVGEVPVVITSLNWTWPKECDWIPTEDKIPFPTVLDVQISVVESFSAQQFNNFDIQSFRDGDMVGAYSTPPVRVSNTVDEAKAEANVGAGGGRGFINPPLVQPPAGGGRGFINPPLVQPDAGGGRGFVNPSSVKPPEGS